MMASLFKQQVEKIWVSAQSRFTIKSTVEMD